MLPRTASPLSWLSPVLALLLLPACTFLVKQTQTPASPAASAQTIASSQTAKSEANSLRTTPTVAAVSDQVSSSQTVTQAVQPTQRPTSRTSRSYPQAPDQKGSVTTASQSLSVVEAINPTFRSTQRLAGFSATGSYFLYLESSRDTGAGIPRSNLQVVDLSTNDCVANGCRLTRYGEQDADRSLADAENDLLQQTQTLRQDLKLTQLAAGTVLPIQSRSRSADGTEVITVQAANREQPIQIRLSQKQIASPLRGGTAERDRAALQLEVTIGGQKRVLGSLDNYRDWVLDYSVREVRLAPNGTAIAILITATQPTFEGTLATTLVQGFELQ